MIITCDICNKRIEENELHNSVNLHRERLTGNSITVDSAENILTTCISCGRNINKAAIAKVLSAPNSEKAELLAELLIPIEAN